MKMSDGDTCHHCGNRNEATEETEAQTAAQEEESKTTSGKPVSHYSALNCSIPLLKIVFNRFFRRLFSSGKLALLTNGLLSIILDMFTIYSQKKERWIRCLPDYVPSVCKCPIVIPVPIAVKI